MSYLRSHPCTALGCQFALVAAVALMGIGCTALVGIEDTELQVCGDGQPGEGEQCDGELHCAADCTWQEGYDFSCLNQERQAADSETLTLSFDVSDLNAPGVPLVETRIRVCGSLDRDCHTPLHETATGSDGKASLQVSVPFEGSVEFFKEGFIVLQKYRLAPVYSDEHIPAEMLSLPLFDQLSLSVAGSSPDTSRGHITAEVHDCRGARAGGLQIDLTNSDGASSIYFGAAVPDPELSATSPESARWVAFNVSAERQHVMALRDGEELMSGIVNVRAAVLGSPGGKAIPVVSNILLAPAE